MRGDGRGNGFGGNGFNHNYAKGTPLFKSLETSGNEGTTLLGMMGHTTQEESLLRRGVRGLAQVGDLIVALLVAGLLVPIGDFNNQSNVGHMMIAAAAVLFGSALSSVVRRTRLVTNTWVFLRTIFYMIAVGLCGMNMRDNYNASLNADGSRSPIPPMLFAPLLFCFFALLLSLVLSILTNRVLLEEQTQ